MLVTTARPDALGIWTGINRQGRPFWIMQMLLEALNYKTSPILKKMITRYHIYENGDIDSQENYSRGADDILNLNLTTVNRNN